jgi:hypothetical protein
MMVANVRRDSDSLVFLEAEIGAYRRYWLEMVVNGESGGTRGQYSVLVPEKEDEKGDEKGTDEQDGLPG